MMRRCFFADQKQSSAAVFFGRVYACAQEALADGQEGMLALQEALERTVDAARGLLERAEVAAAEAEEGEVSSNASTVAARS